MLVTFQLSITDISEGLKVAFSTGLDDVNSKVPQNTKYIKGLFLSAIFLQYLTALYTHNC